MEKEKEDKIISIDLEGEDEDDSKDEGGNDAVDDDKDEYDDVGEVDGDINQCNSDNLNLLPESNSGSTNEQKTKHKVTRAVKDILTTSNTRFMNNFDPEFSNRERRKLTRKLNSDGKKNGSVSDDNGVTNGVEKDVCDCLNEECPGCHFPCPKCRSCKCGIECRVNRKWMYEAIENESEVAITQNADNPVN